MDVEDKDNEVIVRAEAPGFEAGDFEVQFLDGQLTLRAVRKAETKRTARRSGRSASATSR